MNDTTNRTYSGTGFDHDVKITTSFNTSGKAGQSKNHWLVDLLKRW